MYPEIRVEIRFVGTECAEYFFFDTVAHVRRYVAWLLREEKIVWFVGLGWVWSGGMWHPVEESPWAE